MRAETTIDGPRGAATPWRAYGLAVLATLVALGMVAALLPLTDQATYAPLLGAVVVAVWYGGLGPGLVSIALGWAFSYWALVRPRFSLDVASTDEFVRWLVPLVVALLIVSISWAMQRGLRRATRRARRAERSRSISASLQELASALSSAATPMEVAHALVVHMPPLLGATGGALGLLENESLVIVDPKGAPRQSLSPGLQLSLQTRAPIAEAALTGELVYTNSRPEFERDFPDGARLAPDAAGALAIPVRAGGQVVASMGFPFAKAGAVDEERISIARIAADLGGQALERAGLYEAERATRAGLERVARLAPLFAAETPDVVAAAVCREARETLGADVAQIWDPVGSDHFEVLWRDPPASLIPSGTRIAFANFPGLRETMERLETMFVPDALEHLVGAALGHARELGIRSSLRVPIVLEGRVERILALQWERVITPPPPQLLALARRFADQAGLALEQAERRRAQEAAARSAADTRRLLATTAALAGAATPEDVARAALEESCSALRAGAGALMRREAEHLEMMAWEGYADDELDAWGRLDLEAGVPVADSVRRNEIITIASAAELVEHYPRLAGVPTRHEAYLSVPLSVDDRAIGALWLSFEQEREFGASDLEYASALARQAGQALERAMLLKTEHVARSRAERMAGDLAQLHALATSLGGVMTTERIAELVSERATAVAGADTAGLYLLAGDGGVELLGCIGSLAEGLLARHRRVALAEAPHLYDALRSASPIWLLAEEDRASSPEPLMWGEGGASATGIVPLLVEDRPIGIFFGLWRESQTPDEAQRRLVETIARQAAQPLERARLLERERVARRAAEVASERTRRLQDVTARLSRAVTVIDVGEACLGVAMEAIEAPRGIVALVDHDDIELSSVAGYAVAPHTRLPLDAQLPFAEAIRSGAPVWALEETDASRYPAMRELAGGGSDRAWLALPLSGRQGTHGALLLGFDEATEVALEDREWLVALAGQCAQALERSRIYDEELVSRRRSERLQGLTAALSGALTPDEVASVFLDQAMPELGVDGASLAVIDPDGRMLRTVGRRGYPAELSDERTVYPVSQDAPAATAFRLGRPAYYEHPDVLRAAFPGRAEVIDRIGHHTFAFVPLSAGSAPLGVAALSWDAAIRLTADERTFIEVLASQAGLALDRAGRYETERTIAETLQRSVLPESLPTMEGVQVAARYLPGTSAVDVGGDWFEPSRCPTADSASWSATWWVKASGPPPRWPSCATGCERSRSTPSRPRRP